jgi:hypothetical protein
MLCCDAVAIVRRPGNTTTALCAQGVVLVNDLNAAASKLEKATRANDFAYLYMFDNHNAKHAAAEIAHGLYEDAATEWAMHRVGCMSCRRAS